MADIAIISKSLSLDIPERVYNLLSSCEMGYMSKAEMTDALRIFDQAEFNITLHHISIESRLIYRHKVKTEKGEEYFVYAVSPEKLKGLDKLTLMLPNKNHLLEPQQATLIGQLDENWKSAKIEDALKQIFQRREMAIIEAKPEASVTTELIEQIPEDIEDVDEEVIEDEVSSEVADIPDIGPKSSGLALQKMLLGTIANIPDGVVTVHRHLLGECIEESSSSEIAKNTETRMSHPYYSKQTPAVMNQIQRPNPFVKSEVTLPVQPMSKNAFIQPTVAKTKIEQTKEIAMVKSVEEVNGFIVASMESYLKQHGKTESGVLTSFIFEKVKGFDLTMDSVRKRVLRVAENFKNKFKVEMEEKNNRPIRSYSLVNENVTPKVEVPKVIAPVAPPVVEKPNFVVETVVKQPKATHPLTHHLTAKIRSSVDNALVEARILLAEETDGAKQASYREMIRLLSRTMTEIDLL